MPHDHFLQGAVLFTLFLIPVTLFSEPDESMPKSIPAEVIADWKDQGGTADEIKNSLSAEYQEKCDGSFESACHWRRVSRMKPYMTRMKKVLYAKHFNFGGGNVGYLEGIRSARGSNWEAGSALYILDMNNYYPEPEILLADLDGVIKDPCISPDGSYLVFAWWKKEDDGGFHIYELNMETKATRRITGNPVGLEVGDYEPCILPTGDIMFNSSRVFGVNDCGYSVVSNLYICNRNGDWLRRIGYDQEHTFHPVMMSKGKVLYSRREYNDRTRISCGGYFTMNPDGCMQVEYWGNQSDFPLMKYQAREIPNSGGKLMGIAGGHLAPYQGEVIRISPGISRNRWPGNDNQSIELLAPLREAPMDPSDAMSAHDGGVEHTFQNPWPFDEDNFLVSWDRDGRRDGFQIYFFNADASRELIAWNRKMSVSQPIVIDPPCPFDEPPQLLDIHTDYTGKTGVFGVSNVNYGMGSADVPEGTIKKIRVLAIGPYRTNYSSNTGILGFAVIPIGRAFSSWQVKRLLGEMPVESDGSACFEVPANTPIYFQTVDEDGRMVNTMRSWSTLMPGERFDCMGCHEDKNVPCVLPPPIAATPKPLETPLGIEDEFMSFPKIIQPILDRRCVSCHNEEHEKGLDLQANPTYHSGARRSFNQSYNKLTASKGKYLDWITQESKAAPISEFPAPGSGTSPMADKLLDGHAPDSMTREELETIFCWIDMMIPHAGAFSEGMLPEDSAAYEEYLTEHRLKHAQWEKENIAEFIAAGQWSAPIYQDSTASDPEYSAKPQIRKDVFEGLLVTSFEGRLVVQCPTTGILSLLDMKGRLLKNVNVKDVTKNGKLQITLPWTFSSGIYIVRFRSGKVIRQRVISSL